MYFCLVLIADQIVKYFVSSTNLDVSILGDWFNLIYIKNTGGMYGVFENNNFIFIVISMLVMIALSIYVINNKELNATQKIIWQVILAGGTSNLIDRIFRGAVVDFIQMKFFGVFNLSDVCIVIGAVIICIIELKEFFSSGNYKKRSN